jgi:hypothetical protein
MENELSTPLGLQDALRDLVLANRDYQEAKKKRDAAAHEAAQAVEASRVATATCHRAAEEVYRQRHILDLLMAQYYGKPRG